MQYKSVRKSLVFAEIRQASVMHAEPNRVDHDVHGCYDLNAINSAISNCLICRSSVGTKQVNIDRYINLKTTEAKT